MIEIKHKIARIVNAEQIEEFAPIWLSGEALTVYIDINDLPGFPAFGSKLIKSIHRRINKISPTCDAIVVGPVDFEDHNFLDDLARIPVRATKLSFDDYCEDIQKHRLFCKRVRAGK